MSIWKEIKKSINSDLNVPLNELAIFPKSIIQSQNLLLRLKTRVMVGDVEQKATDYDIEFFCKGTINIRATYYVGTHVNGANSVRQGMFYIKINGNVVKEIPLYTRETSGSNRVLTQTIDVNCGDILSCSAVVNAGVTNGRIDNIAILADIVPEDMIEELES